MHAVVGSTVGLCRDGGHEKGEALWIHRNPDATGKMWLYGIETLSDVELLALFYAPERGIKMS